MGLFIEGCERRQTLFLADCVDDYVGAENRVRVIDVFIDELDLAAIGSEGAAATGLGLTRFGGSCSLCVDGGRLTRVGDGSG